MIPSLRSVRKLDGISGKDITVCRNDLTPGIYWMVLAKDGNVLLLGKLLIAAH
jgi:hypothetical protein